jgi:predicted hydrocarbon binding protein
LSKSRKIESPQTRMIQLYATLYRQRTISFPLSSIRTLKSQLGGLLQSGADYILFNAFKAVGRDDARSLEDLGVNDEEALLNALSQIYEAMGWGNFKFQEVDLKKTTCSIVVRNSFEALNHRRTLKPVCYIIRGHLTGALSYIFKREVPVNEVKCFAKGDSECVFEAKL